MKKKNIFFLFYLPFLFPFVYKIKIPLNTFSGINLLDLFLLSNVFLGLLFIIKNNLFFDFKKQCSKKIPLLKIFLLFATIATLVNLKDDWIGNLSLLKSFFILPVAWSLIFLYLSRKGFLKIQILFRCYFIYSIFLAILTLVFKFQNFTTFDNRVTLFFDSPNQLAISLSLGIIALLLLSKENKFLFWFLIIFLPALWFTKSTGALVAIGFILIIFLLKIPIQKQLLIFKTILLISFLGALLLVLIPEKEFLKNAPFENKNSLDSRTVIYLVTSKIISGNFWDGVGPGNFQTTYLAQQPYFPPYPQWAVPHAHNLFLNIWVTFGFFSLVFFTIFLYKKTPSVNKQLTEAFYLFLLYFLIHGLVDVPIWNNDQALFFWFIVLF